MQPPMKQGNSNDFQNIQLKRNILKNNNLRDGVVGIPLGPWPRDRWFNSISRNYEI